MEIAKIICCTISFITVFLGGLYVLNTLIHYFFENHKEKKRLQVLKEQNTKIDKLKTEEEKIDRVETQLKEINKRLEVLDPMKQREKKEKTLKYLIEKLKENEKVDLDIISKYLTDLNNIEEQANN